MNYKCHSYSNKTWRHASIFVSPENWDKIKFMSASSGLKTSSWIMKKIKEYGNKIPPKTYDGSVSKSICVEEADWEVVKVNAERAGMTVSRYVVGVLLDTEGK